MIMEPTPATPPATGTPGPVLTHCCRSIGMQRQQWHWYVDGKGEIQACGLNQKAIEAALRGLGYTIQEADGK